MRQACVVELGQPQHRLEDLKWTSTTLLPQNAHVVIPFVLFSRGYVLLWNNLATARADFATNCTRWLTDHGPTGRPSSPAVSGRPQIRFAFCTA